MINTIIKSISRKINNDINKDSKYTIYTENVEQDLKRPCFFIYCQNYSDELFRGKRYKRSTDIVVEFIPDDSDSLNSDTNKVIEDLYDITENIEYDNSILCGINRSVSNAENGIAFNVRYEYFYYKEDNADMMMRLEERTDVKNGNRKNNK